MGPQLVVYGGWGARSSLCDLLRGVPENLWVVACVGLGSGRVGREQVMQD